MTSALRPKDHPVLGVTGDAVILLDTGIVGLDDGATGKASVDQLTEYTRTKSEWGDLAGNLSSQTDLQIALNDKQPRTTVLDETTASYTVAEETKLDGIEVGAEVNVATNWGDIGGTLSDQTDLKNALDGKVTSVVAGTNITVDDTDPNNPVISSSAASTDIKGISKTGGFTATSKDLFSVTGDADITMPVIVAEDIFEFYSVSGVVRLLNPLYTIVGSAGSIVAGEDMIIETGVTVKLVAETENILRMTMRTQ